MASRGDTTRPGDSPADRVETVELRAADGYRLAADLHLPPEAVERTVLLAPAMGVRRGFYGPLASYLTEAGLAVLVLDYRGIGGSAPPRLRGFPARLVDWAELDLAAGLQALGARFPGVEVGWLGHSVGGQLFGLLRQAPVRRAVFVGSQSGWAGHWDGLGRAVMTGLWYAAVPILVAATGRLPMKAVGQGEDVPPGVARQWAAWGRQRDYLMSYARHHDGLGFQCWSGRLRSWAIADDPYAPRRAVEALVGMYRVADAQVAVVTPAEVGTAAIGHFGAFRRPFRDTLWRSWRDALCA
jgi:predicted alpha/beta hydrolase